jgi:hypothetical protein
MIKQKTRNAGVPRQRPALINGTSIDAAAIRKLHFVSSPGQE